MRLLLAARLSKLYDGQTGIETQDQRGREWAEREGHAIVAVAADRKSGTVAPWDRPNLRPWVTKPELMARYDGILAFKNDRLSRGCWSDEARIRQWAEEHGKHLVIVDGPQWPPRHDGDEWSWEAQSKQARKEWEQIQERSVRAQRYLRANGYLVGRPPFGYRIVCAERCGKSGSECRHHKALEPDPRLVPYVKEMADRYLNGATFTSICEWLDSEGIKPSGGGAWKQKTVRTVLSNPALIGRRKDGQGRTILRFEPILDQVTFKRLQARLEASRVKPARGAVAEAPALLAGVIHCAWCGRVMYRRSAYNVRKDGSKQYNLYYRCDGSLRDRSTCKNMVPLADADDWVSSWFAGTIGHLELTERIVIPGHNHEDEIAEVAAEIRDLDLDDPDYLAKQSALMAERKRLKELPATPGEVVERPTGVTIGQHWAALDTAGRRAWLLDRQVKVMAYRPPAKGRTPEGAPPFTFDVGFEIAGVLMRRTADGAYEVAKDQPATGQEIPASDPVDLGQLVEWVKQRESE